MCYIMAWLRCYSLVETTSVFYHGQNERLRAYLSKYVKGANKKAPLLDRDQRDNTVLVLGKDAFRCIQRKSFFSYNESQATSVAQIVETAVDYALYSGKRTIIIKGSAGTWKSVVAINTIGQLINNEEVGHNLNAAYVTSNAE